MGLRNEIKGTKNAAKRTSAKYLCAIVITHVQPSQGADVTLTPAIVLPSFRAKGFAEHRINFKYLKL